MIRCYKFRMYPTRAQEHALHVLLGNLRFLYNACLQERRDAYRAGVKVTGATQEKAITVIKNDAECPNHAYPFGWYGQRAPVRHEPRHTRWYVCGGRGVAE